MLKVSASASSAVVASIVQPNGVSCFSIRPSASIHARTRIPWTSISSTVADCSFPLTVSVSAPTARTRTSAVDSVVGSRVFTRSSWPGFSRLNESSSIGEYRMASSGIFTVICRTPAGELMRAQNVSRPRRRPSTRIV